MKRVLLLITIIFSFVELNAQVFNYKQVLDKFDDVISEGNKKSLITQLDSMIIIEEKGSNPNNYRILNYADYNSMGDKDNIVNLVGNVYGYQECWCVVKNQDYDNYMNNYVSIATNFTDKEAIEKEITKMIYKYCYYIIHRVVVSQYTHEFIAAYWWVTPADENQKINRIVYSNR